ncbi:MAG: VPLPA-CTERM sorting domain-containing protein [Gammaproteobacteria bacterium]|nr:VPLPA-CTERM sorting domain-containing protein [Gammaproteobacteria bacterium]
MIGDSIIYEYDESANSAALALFGAPDIVGDTVRFLSSTFRAESNNGEGAVVETANFVFSRVYSISGGDIMDIEVVEFGDYEISGGDAAEADVLLTASSNVDLLDFTSSSDSFDAAGDSGGLMTWQMQVAVDPGAAFSSAANDMALSLQNTLRAVTDANGETAWIQKKLTLVATTVPVPAAVWLFGSALGLLGWMRRRAA